MLKKWVKIFFITVAVLVLLLTATLLALHTAWGKSVVAAKLCHYLEEKLHTRVTIGSLDYRLPNWIAVSQIYLGDMKNDTLLKGDLIRVELNMLQLMRGRLLIHELKLEGVTAKINRDAANPDFNYQFLIDAFAGGKPAKEKAPSVPSLTLSRLTVQDLNLTYADYREEQQYAAHIGTFTALTRQIDLERNHFVLDRWYLADATIRVSDRSLTQPPAPRTNTASKPFSLEAAALALHRVNFEFSQLQTHTVLQAQIDSLLVKQPIFALQKRQVEAMSLQLVNSSIRFRHQQEPESGSANADAHPWLIRCENIVLEGNTLQYDNDHYARTKQGLDPRHLLAEGMLLHCSELRYEGSGISTKVNRAAFLLDKQLQLKNARGFFQLDSQMVEIDDLRVALGQSEFNSSGNLQFPVSTHSPATSADAIALTIDSSFVSMKDIEWIIPGFRESLPVTIPGDRIDFMGRLDGNAAVLTLDRFRVQTSDRSAYLDASGKLYALDRPEQFRYAVHLENGFVSSSILKDSLQRQLAASQIRLPQSAYLLGSFSGNSRQLSVMNFSIGSSFGFALLNGTFTNIGRPESLGYQLRVNARRLETGKWFGADSLMGPLTGMITLRGAGTTPQQLQAAATLQVDSFWFNRYTYSGIQLNANSQKGRFELEGTGKDPNLEFTLLASGNWKPDQEAVIGQLVLKKAALFPLHWAVSPTELSTRLRLNAKNIDPESLDFSLWIDSTVLIRAAKRTVIDSITLLATSDADSTELKLNAAFGNLLATGNYHYNELPAQLKNYFNRQFDAAYVSTAAADQQISLRAALFAHPLWEELVPGLQLEAPIQLVADFDNRFTDSVLRMKLSIPRLNYHTLALDQFALEASGTDSAIQLQAGATALTNGGQVYRQPAVKGMLQRQAAQLELSVRDNEGKPFYGLHTKIGRQAGELKMELTDEVMLNHELWPVQPGNSLRIRPEGYHFSQFGFAKEGQSLLINNTGAGFQSPIQVSIKAFELSNLLALLNKDSLLAAGSLHADLTIQQPIDKIPGIKGPLGIDGLQVNGILIGDLKVNSEVGDRQLRLSGGVSGTNTLALEGSLGLQTGNIAAEIDLASLNLATVEAFSGGVIRRSSGKITGRATVAGSITQPTWKGVLTIQQAAFAVNAFNSLYRIEQESIVFDYPDIRFADFEVKDSLGNSLRINGKIKSLADGGFALDLSARARNFVAINAQRKPESVLYGTGIIDANLQIGGNSNEPLIQGSARLKTGSAIHYIVPQKANYSAVSHEAFGFIKADTIDNLASYNRIQAAADSNQRSGFRSLKYNLNLEVDKEAILTVVVDPLTNDELQIQGTAQINAGIAENGEIGLNGVYQLESGYYNLNYKLIKRKFELTKGSTITFSGDPLLAQADITAQYETTASASDLLGNEISAAEGNLGSGYTQKIPFLVILNIKGPLTKPELTFDLKLKAGTEGVNASLATAIENKLAQIRYDASAMNKQVFGILILNRFIGEKSSDFFGGAGFHADVAARESVSRFLTEAVNQLADDLIKGVDLDINLRNYETGDNQLSRTDVDLAVSKLLLDDRLSISIGKNFTVEGNDPARSTAAGNNSQFVPDIATTYKLSKDGRYMLRAYRKNQYEAQLDGYFIETGVSFSISMDYNKFRELFKNSKKNSGRSGSRKKTAASDKP